MRRKIRQSNRCTRWDTFFHLKTEALVGVEFRVQGGILDLGSLFLFCFVFARFYSYVVILLNKAPDEALVYVACARTEILT